MDPLVITAIIGGAIALTGTIINAVETEKKNEENKALQEKANAENLDLAKNGLQYKVDDAVKAGFSPLAALGANGLQSGIVSAPTVQSADYSGLSSFGNSMFSTMINKHTSEKQLDETKRHNISTEGLENQKNEIAKLQIDSDVKIKMMSLNNALTIARENINSQESINKLRLATEELLQDKTFKHQIAMQNSEIAHQVEQLEKSLKSNRGNVLINNGFNTLDTIISTLGSIYGRGSSSRSYIPNSDDFSY